MNTETAPNDALPTVPYSADDVGTDEAEPVLRWWNRLHEHHGKRHETHIGDVRRFEDNAEAGWELSAIVTYDDDGTFDEYEFGWGRPLTRYKSLTISAQVLWWFASLSLRGGRIR